MKNLPVSPSVHFVMTVTFTVSINTNTPCIISLSFIQCSACLSINITLFLPSSLSQEEHLPPVDDGFLDMISKTQSRRLDDQRSTFPDSAANTPEDARHITQGGGCCDEDDLFDTLWRLQGARIDDQRCDMPSPANGLSHHGADDQERWEEGEAECLSSDELFDMIFECQVRSVQFSL